MAILTQIVKIDPVKIQDSKLMSCAESLRSGGLVAFPTETVYGLGANALMPDAVKAIYEAKGRPQDNPLIVHVSCIEEVFPLVLELSDKVRMLMERFWPGPLTLLFPRSKVIPDVVTAGLPTVAIRMPDHPVAQRLIHLAKVPVAAPSANLSGKPSPVTFEEVYADLNGRVHYIVDGGPSGIGVESTVLDVSGDTPIILRPGGLGKEELESVLGHVEVAGSYKGSTPPCPGMKYRHYAPKGQVMLAHGTRDQQRLAIVSSALKEALSGRKVLILGSTENLKNYERLKELYPHYVEVVELGSVQDLSRVASRLFSSLRFADQIEASMILSESFPTQGLGLAIKNRLEKASGGRYLPVQDGIKLLLICSGNTCRSPMAQVLFEDAWKRHSQSLNIGVSSAGTSAMDGVSATPEAREVMARRGIDLSNHSSRLVSARDIAEADLVITMGTSHKFSLLQRLPEYPSKIYTLSEVVPHAVLGDVVDPFGRGIKEYENAALILQNAMEELAGVLAEVFLTNRN
jgi:L-threonylcarbamoyladenylate synthase